MSQFIGSSVTDGVLEIIINRPDKRNALTAEMYAALADTFETAEQDERIGVILIHGGEKSFTAGNDLVDFQVNPPIDQGSPVFRFMRALLRSTKVVVAGVTGMAVGIGTTLLLHCDLVVAGEGARFAVPFVALGLVPEYASSQLLPAAMGRQRAARHLLLGDPFDAQTAYACGIVSAVVADDRVIAEARDYCQRLIGMPPLALARSKALLRGNADEIEALIVREAGLLAEGLTGAEFAEAVQAFAEKRPPRFVRQV
ncbi:enoyl-CoA hydratase [Sphingobium sp. CR2-8]|uniref:enoyl-CoA hydratase n=1 Tax=Sphingobium sp. CR2-8 TaxID=1306534 RepID=UPI002DB5D167|nr:enoyl-CoA hydratase [Sphingobium sp. CR2-8]MEC3909230.1 enoyl-CoA hydratase [Sphingobium sp. CR2-8]